MFVEHNNLVLISTIINDMSESQEAVGPIKDGRAPSWIAFVSNGNVLIMTMYSIITTEITNYFITF